MQSTGHHLSLHLEFASKSLTRGYLPFCALGRLFPVRMMLHTRIAAREEYRQRLAHAKLRSWQVVNVDWMYLNPVCAPILYSMRKETHPRTDPHHFSVFSMLNLLTTSLNEFQASDHSPLSAPETHIHHI